MKPKYIKIEDIKFTETPTDIVKQANDQYEKNRSLIDPYVVERNRTWSLLANQVVGGEI